MTEYHYYLDGQFYDRMSDLPDETSLKLGAKIVAERKLLYDEKQVWLESYPKYHTNWHVGELLFEKVMYGGKLRVISWDGKLVVDVSVKYELGVYGMALKRPDKKRYGKHYVKTSDEIIRYLAQFRELSEPIKEKDQS